MREGAGGLQALPERRPPASYKVNHVLPAAALAYTHAPEEKGLKATTLRIVAAPKRKVRAKKSARRRPAPGKKTGAHHSNKRGQVSTDETYEIYDCISPGPFALPVRIIAAIEKGRDRNEERSFVAVTRPRPSSCPCY
jgi:hypothetical protein